MHITILIPVFNDWSVAQQLVGQLDAALGENSLSAHIVFVDDGSTQRPAQPFLTTLPQNLDGVSVVELKRNLGHQRALCVGLVALAQKNLEGPVLIMDADGEDGAADIALLWQEYLRQGQEKAVFASRKRRAEGLLFKSFYQVYRTIHRVLVGFDIRVGNFSVFPAQFLDKLAVTSDLWNHYAAAVVKIKLPRTTVPINRSRRIGGHSQMGIVSLIVHGLSAISVFGDVVGVRLLIASSILGGVTVCLVIATLAIKFATQLAIPGWTTYAVGLLLLLLSQSVLLSLIFTFIVLYSRGQSGFVPLRDCPIYIQRETILYTKHG